MKIIFLDIDGVLNNCYTEDAFGSYVFVEDEKLLLLKDLVDSTDAQIVLSSSWRKGWFYRENYPELENEDVWLFEALQSKLNENGIELYDYTEEIGVRENEISLWLEKNKNKEIESYVILDDFDEREFRAHINRLIQTDMSEGLTENHVQEAISILNNKQ